MKDVLHEQPCLHLSDCLIGSGLSVWTPGPRCTVHCWQCWACQDCLASHCPPGHCPHWSMTGDQRRLRLGSSEMPWLNHSVMFVILIQSGVSTCQTGSDQRVGQPCPGLWSPAGEWCPVQQVLSPKAHAHRRQWKILGLDNQVSTGEQEIQELTAVYVLRLSIYYLRLDNIKSYKYPVF